MTKRAGRILNKRGVSFEEAQYEKQNKKKIKYTDKPMDNVEVVADFLPPPEELAFKEETVKITITLSKSSIDFFKKKAESHRTPYQKMIRRSVDEYVVRQKQLS